MSGLTKDLPDNQLFCIQRTDYCEVDGVYKPRQNCPDFNWGHTDVNYPATKPYNETHLCNSKITAVRWPKVWVQWYLDLNRHNLRYACDIANGIVNNVNGQVQLEPPYNLDDYPDMPKLEFLSFAGSIHAVDVYDDTGVLLKGWHFSDAPQPGLNFRNSVYISKFTGIVPLGVDGNTDTMLYTNLYDPADDAYHFVTVPDGKSAWVDRREAEMFPPLGDIQIGDKPLIVRSGPGAEYNKVGIVEAGKVVPITRYHPNGYDVWARAGYGENWIPLRYQPTPGRQDYIEPTSWHLESKPGLRPYAHSIPGDLGYVSPFADDEVPPIGGDEVLFQVKVIVDKFNIREGPWVTYPVVKVVVKGTILSVYEVDDAYGWLRVSPDKNLWCSGHATYVEQIETPAPSGDYDQGWNDALDASIDAIAKLRR